MSDPRPACLITGAVSPYRREPFRLLAEAEGVEVIAWGEEPGMEPGEGGPPVRQTTQGGAARLVASGHYRAVICGLGGRVALPAAFLAARRAGVPFVLWASVWAHPRSAAHALSALPTRVLYRHADAVVTYGPHVSAHVARNRTDRSTIFEAPQAVDVEHFGAPVAPERRLAARERAGAADPEGFLVLFVGRLVPEKGVDVLLEAWQLARSRLGRHAVLALAGEGLLRPAVEAAGEGVRALGTVTREDLPALYAAADVLVLPSVRTATFLEPWGLVINEAMLQGTPVIASTAVGAAVGGLVRHEMNGLITPQRDSQALAEALFIMGDEPQRRRELGAAAREDALAYDASAWVHGVRQALRSMDASRL